jgi:COX assembly protein 2
MHPQIVLGEHPCSDAMAALIACHESSVFSRFTGRCNDPAASLDRCLRANKQSKVKQSVLDAREKRKRWEELCVAQGLALGPQRPGAK